MEAHSDPAFWNRAAGRHFAHPLDVALPFAVLTCIPADDAQKNLVAEFKRLLRPGGLLLISDYPLQSDARILQLWARTPGEPGGGR